MAGKNRGRQRIGRVSEVPTEGTVFSYQDGPLEEQAIVLRIADGSIRAYRNECRHLSQRLDARDPGQLWDRAAEHLVCDSHGALYRPHDGLCVAGPCRGSHLKALPIEILDDEVYLDTAGLGSFLDL